MKARTKAATDQIDKLLEEATRRAFAELVDICRDVMKANPQIRNCCIGMGTVAFYDLEGTPLWDDDSRTQAARDFESEYANLGLSGIPAKFTATSPLSHNW